MIERDILLDAIERACTWLTDIAQVREERVPTECARAAHMAQKSWKGAIRGEYSAANKKWEMFAPVWHSGQAAKALCMAYQLTGEKKWLDSACMAGEFILNQQITDENNPEYGLIYAIEDYVDCVTISGIMEALDGLFVLAEVSGEQKYQKAALLAAAWLRENTYMGDGHFQDNYSVSKGELVLPQWWFDWYNPPEGFEKRVGRPLADGAVFLKTYKLTEDSSYRDIFYATVDYLRNNEIPAGTWNNYIPSLGAAGLSHPRQSYWWGMPMYDAYMDTKDTVYYECLKRCGEWYLRAQRADGGMFRNTDLQFNTPCFGICTSAISCASIIWMSLYTIDHETKWLDAVERALRFNLSVQFRNTSDPNLEGAVLEVTEMPNGSDASPYYLRDLSTILFIQAAVKYLNLLILGETTAPV